MADTTIDLQLSEIEFWQTVLFSDEYGILSVAKRLIMVKTG